MNPEGGNISSWDEAPLEILTHISSYLSASTRQDFRRTCSAWYDACNTYQILKTEKIVIRGGAIENRTLLFDTLIAIRRKCFNLEFHDIKMEGSSMPFWEDCGPQILSLTFRECVLENDQILPQILTNCLNLQCLEIDRTVCTSWEFVQCNVVLRDMVTLTLRSCDYMCDHIYNVMVRTFPNIQELNLLSLHLNCCKRVDMRFYAGNETAYDSRDIFSFSCVFNHLKSNASHIKKLSLHSFELGGLTSDWINDIGTIPNLRLDYLSLEQHSEFSNESLINLLSMQTDLKKLRLHCCSTGVSYATAYHALKNCSQLECLDLRITSSKCDIEYKLMLHSLLLSAKLKEIHLFDEDDLTQNEDDTEDEDDITQRNGEKSFPKVDNVNEKINNHVRALTCSKISIDFVTINVKAYRSLTSLTLQPNTWYQRLELNDVDLQIVFHVLIHLETFKVCIGPDVSDYAFTGKIDLTNDVGCDGIESPYSSSIRNLKNLRLLEIGSEFSCKSRITRRTFDEIAFPHLESLRLTFKNRSFFPDEHDWYFQKLPKNVPSLKYFTLLCKCIFHEEVCFLLQSMEKLVVLNLRNTPVIARITGMEVLGPILYSHNSLRRMKRGAGDFYRDVFTLQWTS